MKRGQGTFEYVLLLGGVLLIVVLAIVVLQNTASSGFQGTGGKQCNARLLGDLACLSAGASWNECGQVNATLYKDCGSIDPSTTGSCGSLATGMKYCGKKPLS